jgi:hypothetical protein
MAAYPLCIRQDDKEKERLKAGLTGAILSEKPNVKVREFVAGNEMSRLQVMRCRGHKRT